MNITEIQHKIKEYTGTHTGQTILIILILIISNIGSFYLGRESIQNTNTKDSLNTGDTNDYSLSDPQIYKTGSLAAAIYNSSQTPKIDPNEPNTSQSGEVVTDNLNKMDNTTPRYVASKKGRVYYFTWCAGAKSILEENRIYFKTAQDARGAGLKPSTACPGLD